MSAPVDSHEVEQAVLAMLVERFGDRPLDIETARLGLACAAFELNMMHLREVDKTGGNIARLPPRLRVHPRDEPPRAAPIIMRAR